MTIAFWVSIVVLVASVALFAHVWRGIRRMRRLADVAPDLATPPRVSLIVSALDEAETIEPALRSMLALDYPGLQVIAIDDRSTDATGSILDRLAAEFPRLRVVHIRELPAGWLGKNHALDRGAAMADGDYLLFTDADIVFEPTALARALAYCARERLDHLTIFPEVPTRNLLLQAAMVHAVVGLYAMYQPWKVRTERKRFMGIGAFNLVRAEAYRAAGGHAEIAMEILDDVMLGKSIKDHGFSSDILVGADMLSVEMYRSTGEMMRASQKNSFTFLDYSMPKLVAATLVTFALSVWPWIGALALDGPARWINFATLAAGLVLHLALARSMRYDASCAFFWPVIPFLMLGLMWHAALKAVLSGTIVWRGTAYPLAEIRRRHRAAL